MAIGRVREAPEFDLEEEAAAAGPASMSWPLDVLLCSTCSRCTPLRAEEALDLQENVESFRNAEHRDRLRLGDYAAARQLAQELGAEYMFASDFWVARAVGGLRRLQRGDWRPGPRDVSHRPGRHRDLVVRERPGRGGRSWSRLARRRRDA